MEERLKVLIVDDEPIARKFLRVCIDWEAAGFTISAEAGGGAEALDLMEVDTPDIVFADIQMPFMDGLTFSRIVAKQYPQVKIVILTAHQNFTYAKESVGIGVQDFLLKTLRRCVYDSHYAPSFVYRFLYIICRILLLISGICNSYTVFSRHTSSTPGMPLNVPATMPASV